MSKHGKATNRRIARTVGAALFAGGLLLAAPTGLAFAEDPTDGGGDPVGHTPPGGGGAGPTGPDNPRVEHKHTIPLTGAELEIEHAIGDGKLPEVRFRWDEPEEEVAAGDEGCEGTTVAAGCENPNEGGGPGSGEGGGGGGA